MQSDPGPVVVIGLKEIYDKVVGLAGKVEAMIGQHAAQGQDIADHEMRLRVLEEAQSSRRLSRLEEGVESLKAGRWPLPALAVLLSLAALVWTILSRIA